MTSTSPHQNQISMSQERNTFQKNSYIAKCGTDGTTPSLEVIGMYKQWADDVVTKEADPNWQQNNLEYDLRTTNWILEKARGDQVYAQHIYAALCNNDWQRTDPWAILKDEVWSCSWRHAGGIVADMMQEGDYIEWYCSGIQNEAYEDAEWIENATEEQIALRLQAQASVPESVITDEIRGDFLKLGWQCIWVSDEH